MTNTETKDAQITVEDRKLNIPHLGLTLRSILGAAIANRSKIDSLSRNRAVYPVFYKGVQVCAVRLGKDFVPHNTMKDAKDLVCMLNKP